jgi:hypothetical protein
MSDEAMRIQSAFVRLIFSDAEYQQFISSPIEYAATLMFNTRQIELLNPCATELFVVERQGRKKLAARELRRAFPRTFALLCYDNLSDSEIINEFMDSDEFFGLGNTPCAWTGLYGYDNRPKFFKWARIQPRYARLTECLKLDFAVYLTGLTQYSHYPYYENFRHGLLVESNRGKLFVKNGVVIGVVESTQAQEALTNLGAQNIERFLR